MANTAPLVTLTPPVTSRLLVPIPVTSLRAKVASRVAPVATVMLPFTVVGPPSTTQYPEITTLEE